MSDDIATPITVNEREMTYSSAYNAEQAQLLHALIKSPNYWRTNEADSSIYRQVPDPIEGRWEFVSPFYGFVLDSEQKWNLRNKFEIAYTIVGNKGPWVLFLHGVPTNRYQYAPLMKRLAPFCRCIAIDMLGMGESSKPRKYGVRVDEDLLQKYALQIQGKAWDWINDTIYIHDMMLELVGEKFIFVADDWGGGIATHYAAKYNNTLQALILLDPIAFDGYPVAEIQAIGRADKITDEAKFMSAMGAFDQTLVQIFKTMVHRPNKVYNQYSLRSIKSAYIEVDYERLRPEAASTASMNLKWPAIRVLAERASILAPALLLPYSARENPRGIKYDKITVPTLVLWGENDNMMPANQIYRFKYVLTQSRVHIQLIPKAGHFVVTDQPDRVATAILNFLETEMGTKALADIFLGFSGIWKGDEDRLIQDLRSIYGKHSDY